MPVASYYVLHGINAAGSTFISQISDGGPQFNVESMALSSAGQPGVGFRGARSVDPVFPFTSTQVSDILGLTGPVSGGFAWKDLSGGNTDLWFKKGANAGTRTADASSAHKRLRAAKAFLVVDRLRASNRTDATIDGAIHTWYDGTNAPVVIAGSTALAGTSTADQSFGLGPIYLNSSAIGGEQDVTFDTGIQLKKLSAASDPYNTLISVESFNQQLTISCLDDTILETVGRDGLAITGLVVYLRKKTANGLYVANGTGSHISLTWTSGFAHVVDAKAGDNRTSTVTFKAEMIGAPTIAVNATIP